MYIQVNRIIENVLSLVDLMEVDLNESLQYFVWKGAGFKQTKWLEKSGIRHQIAHSNNNFLAIPVYRRIKYITQKLYFSLCYSP